MGGAQQTTMLRTVLNKTWKQHLSKQQLYGHLPPFSKTIQVRRTRHAGHCWRSKNEIISDVLLWTPSHKCASVGRPRTYEGAFKKFPEYFFIWALLLIVRTWNSSPLWSNLLRLQCTSRTVPTTSGRSHGSRLVWACQWPLSQPLSSPQLSHNDNLKGFPWA